MRILIVQLVSPRTSARTGTVLPRFDHDLGVAAAVLKSAGAEVALAAVDGFNPQLLDAAVERHHPTHALMDIPPYRQAAARHCIVHLHERHGLAVIAVGVVATSQPELAVSIPGVTAVIVGEPERALAQLVQLPADAQAAANKPGRIALPAGAEIPGLWLNAPQGLVKFPPAEPVSDLDALPPPDRKIFQQAASLRAHDGEAVFQVSRGCAGRCSFCLNDWLTELHAACQHYVRRRGVGGVLDEIAAVRQQYPGVRRLAFADHAFASDSDWLSEWSREYPARCGLPYRCQVRLADLDADRAHLLTVGGCRDVQVEIGSGSSFIREEVLALPLSRQQIERGVACLRQEEIRVRAGFFIGAPYESEVSIQETLSLSARLNLDDVVVRVFYPIPGTRAAETCSDNGWISGRGEENFFANRSVLDMPSLPAERIDEIARRFPALLRHSRGRSLWAWLDKLRRLGQSPILGRRK